MVGVARIELATPAMSTQCSTTELHAHRARSGARRPRESGAAAGEGRRACSEPAVAAQGRAGVRILVRRARPAQHVAEGLDLIVETAAVARPGRCPFGHQLRQRALAQGGEPGSAGRAAGIEARLRHRTPRWQSMRDQWLAAALVPAPERSSGAVAFGPQSRRVDLASYLNRRRRMMRIGKAIASTSSAATATAIAIRSTISDGSCGPRGPERNSNPRIRATASPKNTHRALGGKNKRNPAGTSTNIERKMISRRSGL
jgi:hypothetical protein